MLKQFVIILLSIFPFCVDAQSYKESRDRMAEQTTKFLTFKGIELKPGLRMDSLLFFLESKGFKKTELFDYMKEEYGGYNLKGYFYNYHNCDIKIMPIQANKDVVSYISVNFPDANSFKQLKTLYDNLKDDLKEKYYLHGSIESFDDDYINRTESDYLKLNALSRDEGRFKTLFYVSDESSLLLGQIVLTISHLHYGYEDHYYVSLSYCTSDNIIEQLSSYEDDL